VVETPEEDPHYLTLGDVREVLEHHAYRFCAATIERILEALEDGGKVYTDPVLFVREAPGLYAGYLWRKVT
jgi:hypothetical protein